MADIYGAFDVDNDDRVDQCELAYGCLAANQTTDSFECLQIANTMQVLSASDLLPFCEGNLSSNGTQAPDLSYCDSMGVNYTAGFDSYPNLGNIVDTNSCLNLKSRLFHALDVNEDLVLGQCEIHYGCMASTVFDEALKCQKSAEEMQNITMTTIFEECELDYPL